MTDSTSGIGPERQSAASGHGSDVPDGTIPFQEAWEEIDAWLGASGAPSYIVRCNMAVALHHDAALSDRDAALRESYSPGEVGMLRDKFAAIKEAAAYREAIRHVVADSPGTPDSVKDYLRKVLNGS